MIKKIKSLIIFMVLILLLTACGGHDNTSGETDLPIEEIEQKLVIGVGRDFYEGPASPTYLHGSTNVWESLTYLDDQLEPMPQLAESWSVSEDGKTWRFDLREGVFFHDGTPFNAEVAAYNLERLLNHPRKGNTKLTYGDITNIEVVSEYALEITHEVPMPEFPRMVAYHDGAMFSLAAFDENNDIVAPIGTGPFVFQEYIADQSIILVKNENYWGNTPILEEVIFAFIADPNTRLAALQSGEVDALSDVGAVMPEQAIIIEENNDLILKTKLVGTTHYLFFNQNNLFKDNNLLQAVSYALNRQLLVDTVLEGYGIPGESVITPVAVNWLNKGVAPVYNMDKARELVEEALKGKEAEVKLLLHSGISSRWPYKAIAEIMQHELSELNLIIDIEMVDAGEWAKRLQEGNYDITIGPFTLMTGEPNVFFSTHMFSEGNLNKSRSYGYNNSQVDELITKAAVERDADKRREMYLQLQEIASTEGPVVPIYHDVTLYAVNKKVNNFELDVNFKPHLGMVEIK
ncbi:ABC transporter substrate-binding protein [Natronincola ferrireducens]|uniref:Peptide/nickel transport system substrate-binding protein n=1 Tax=Natronincola ferrireducens TaxID=393762 RepID=A0A1G9GKC3_9FIRM|nr:ABC transporter substrate-binding protein [Natronincola ferrireducens]SDL01131.1 peptide/nickel transport system substrate-binding protein [Natronincola ferrireducens]